MNDRAFACCFTGHRVLPAGKTDEIRCRLEDTLEDLIGQGVSFFGCGGALGFDLLAGETVLKLREKHPHIKLIMVLPCRGQDNNWSDVQKRRYASLTSLCDKVRCLAPAYHPGCMRIRNQYLVNHADFCVAYLTGTSGGTFYTVNLARDAGLTVINLAT